MAEESEGVRRLEGEVDLAELSGLIQSVLFGC